MEYILNLLLPFELFNNLFPGVIFIYFLKLHNYFPFNPNAEAYESLFIAYFIGLVINRVASLFLEPVLKALHFFKLFNISDYPEFLQGRKNDDRIKIPIQINNMYRAYFLIFLLLLFLIILKIRSTKDFYFYKKEVIGFLFLIYIFGHSYIKQTRFIKKRLKQFENEDLTNYKQDKEDKN